MRVPNVVLYVTYLLPIESVLNHGNGQHMMNVHFSQRASFQHVPGNETSRIGIDSGEGDMSSGREALSFRTMMDVAGCVQAEAYQMSEARYAVLESDAGCVG